MLLFVKIMYNLNKMNHNGRTLVASIATITNTASVATIIVSIATIIAITSIKIAIAFVPDPLP